MKFGQRASRSGANRLSCAKHFMYKTTVVGLMLAAAGMAVAQQAPSRTAAQAYKNIQILKDIPNTQLIPTMRFIATALGVECEFCHLGDRSADTPNKNTARKMMTMMM